MKSPKRRHIGFRTFGKGNKKNNRGKGSRGGTGRGGYHKDKWMRTLKTEGTTQTAPGFVNPMRKRVDIVALNELALQIGKGKFGQKEGAYAIDLTQKKKRVKVLGNGAFQFKASIKADAFSESAKQKIEKAGGSVLLAKLPAV